MTENNVKKTDRRVIKDVHQMLRGNPASVVDKSTADVKQWTVHGENYPYELADVRDDFYAVSIVIKDGEEEYRRIISKEKRLNSVRLWYLEQLLKQRSGSGKFRKIIQEIEFINDILTILQKRGTRVTVVNEVIPVLKEYEITYDKKCKMTIAFNGSVVMVKGDNGNREFNATGYMDLKLGMLHRGLDKHIKQQQRDYARAVARCKWRRRVTPLRYKLSELVFGRSTSL